MVTVNHKIYSRRLRTLAIAVQKKRRGSVDVYLSLKKARPSLASVSRRQLVEDMDKHGLPTRPTSRYPDAHL